MLPDGRRYRGSASGPERFAQERDRLLDRRVGGVRFAQGVQHHEVVDDRLVADRCHRDACFAQLVRVRLAFVAEDIRFTGDHEGRRQTRELLEAGPQVYPEKDFKMLMWPYDLPHRGAGVGGSALENFGEFLAPNGSWDIAGEPYTSAPGADFQWFRSRIVGGRTNHWGRIALRFAPVDFRSYTRDSLGADWPITYQDLAPYYDKVESYIGVFGTKENVSSAPDGVFLPPPKPRCHELIVKKACDKQLGFLVQNLQHPSLHAKKYDESQSLWQARVNQAWRFYFQIQGDTYYLIDLTPHPKK